LVLRCYVTVTFAFVGYVYVALPLLRYVVVYVGYTRLLLRSRYVPHTVTGYVVYRYVWFVHTFTLTTFRLLHARFYVTYGCWFVIYVVGLRYRLFTFTLRVVVVRLILLRTFTFVTFGWLRCTLRSFVITHLLFALPVVTFTLIYHGLRVTVVAYGYVVTLRFAHTVGLRTVVTLDVVTVIHLRLHVPDGCTLRFPVTRWLVVRLRLLHYGLRCCAFCTHVLRVVVTLLLRLRLFGLLPLFVDRLVDVVRVTHTRCRPFTFAVILRLPVTVTALRLRCCLLLFRWLRCVTTVTLRCLLRLVAVWLIRFPVTFVVGCRCCVVG